jgi:hypothetical protein
MATIKNLDFGKAIVNNIFKDDIMKQAIRHVMGNMENGKENVIKAFEIVDYFFEKHFVERYFIQLITSIELGQCKESSIKYDKEYKYSFKIDIDLDATDFLIFEMDMVIAYTHTKLHSSTYIEEINKKLKKYGLDAVSHSVFCNSNIRMFEIIVDVVLFKGELFNYMNSFRTDILKEKSNINYNTELE